LTRLGRERIVHNLELLDPLTRRRLESILPEANGLVSAGQLEQLAVLTDAVLQEAGVACWIAPTAPCIAPLQSDLQTTDELVVWQARASRNTRCINAMGMTAISLPLPARLPVGLQVVARGGAESTLLAVAGALELILHS
jgi:Asp-tRNA(Asn)/Glu-tRNA(Gln) amidotransferase A subunit family amidase